ncbi:hypothetical protein AVEN_116202-1 [Araneus ventricosus]|uniref:Uncharacterized protein n=1 Tax=Araneus ventricosus TaxID=182803 RepID=A0A4Y2QNW5_ARAVE|nr:hypothetical protein AVEN_116202-1 [Araneus ventricosus]
MTKTTPELSPYPQTSRKHQRKDVWYSTYYLTCNRPNARRIFSGIGSQTFRLQGRHLTTRLPRSRMLIRQVCLVFTQPRDTLYTLRIRWVGVGNKRNISGQISFALQQKPEPERV